ncbi:phosphoribosylanthranilate isomerase [Flavobacterium urocaniciphilum]|uniref:N-(5'-phosphoribosyl)anthranilate isomerase n=1 Tax=Flavobacterium urocaniciphilum TaxID=1299341 RepID=A0A1H8ZKI9_9FLAO|nr:phosphoribosylanthranilate isomerase [Flavobacterium urocaniciphilum]SEP64248.1 phosphoribosylanthranilate isomerase [Flavobacterium urocaniciphilum]
MKFSENIQEIAHLEPDFLGFIFYDNSVRNYLEDTIILIPKSIQKVGVFVNESPEEIIKKISKFNLNFIQLHGNESKSYCLDLNNQLSENQLNIKIIKSFSIDDLFDFSLLNDFQFVDYFLFDTKGKLLGGNGIKFNWKILDKYHLNKPYFLSGGIGLEDVSNIIAFLEQPVSQYCYGIDVNSQFELEAGFKNKEKLQQFKTQLYESV